MLCHVTTTKQLTCLPSYLIAHLCLVYRPSLMFNLFHVIENNEQNASEDKCGQEDCGEKNFRIKPSGIGYFSECSLSKKFIFFFNPNCLRTRSHHLLFFQGLILFATVSVVSLLFFSLLVSSYDCNLGSICNKAGLLRIIAQRVFFLVKFYFVFNIEAWYSIHEKSIRAKNDVC